MVFQVVSWRGEAVVRLAGICSLSVAGDRIPQGKSVALMRSNSKLLVSGASGSGKLSTQAGLV